MSDDPMKTERDWYDATDFDVSKMRRVHLRRSAGAGPLSTFAIRLEGEVIDQLRQVAERDGIGPTQLVREWILDRLAVESQAAANDNDPAHRSALVRSASPAELSAALRPLVREIVSDELRAAKRRTTPVKATAKRTTQIASSKAIPAKKAAAKKSTLRHT